MQDNSVNLQEENKGLRDKIVLLERELVRADFHKMEVLLDQARNEVLENASQLRKMEKELIAVKLSLSWRITSPLREVKRWINSPSDQSWNYFTWFINHSYLPLADSQRKAIYRRVSHFFGIERDFELERAKERLKIEALTKNAFHAKVKNLDLQGRINVLQLLLKDECFTGVTSKKPIVTIIIPIYGQLDYTLGLLASILSNKPRIPFEIIIVDDCSPDDSFPCLSRLQDIRIIKNLENQGFLRSCNIGAKSAQGSFLFFLNNDTEVTPDWLDSLVSTFDEMPGTGLVGSKLIYPDGTLQEAGGIIWQDGSAWNFGRSQDPMLPIYNYLREVDYCSGAAIMVSKQLFDELGGFDERYIPAYCEDADLALQIRNRGYRVLYQPQSTIIHYEGITSGRDIKQGVKAYQEINLKKLYEKWAILLRGHQPNGVDVGNAKDRRSMRRALVVDQNTLSPDQDAGSLLILNMMLLLREMDFQVTFIPQAAMVWVPHYTSLSQGLGIEMLYAPYCVSVEEHLKEFGERYDLVLLVRAEVADKYIDSVRAYAPQAKIVFHTIDLHYLRMQREAVLMSDEKRSGLDNLALQMKSIELMAIHKADMSIVVSDVEINFLEKEGVSLEKVQVFPLIVDSNDNAQSPNGRHDIVFVGGFGHAPNVDAVLYFINEVMPLLRSSDINIKLYVIGSNPPEEIMNAAAKDVILMGHVKKLEPFFKTVKVSIAPLRYGAGVKGKIASSLSFGVPVVATSVGAEGMGLKDGVNVLIADTPNEIAQKLLSLFQDDELWYQLSRNGIQYIDSRLGKDIAYKKLAEILSKLGIDSTPKRYPLKIYTI